LDGAKWIRWTSFLQRKKKLAKQFGIENYVGSAAQNNALQKILEH
jgi:hypothetical protein